MLWAPSIFQAIHVKCCDKLSSSRCIEGLPVPRVHGNFMRLIPTRMRIRNSPLPNSFYSLLCPYGRENNNTCRTHTCRTKKPLASDEIYGEENWITNNLLWESDMESAPETIRLHYLTWLPAFQVNQLVDSWMCQHGRTAHNYWYQFPCSSVPLQLLIHDWWTLEAGLYIV